MKSTNERPTESPPYKMQSLDETTTSQANRITPKERVTPQMKSPQFTTPGESASSALDSPFPCQAMLRCYMTFMCLNYLLCAVGII